METFCSEGVTTSRLREASNKTAHFCGLYVCWRSGSAPPWVRVWISFMQRLTRAENIALFASEKYEFVTENRQHASGARHFTFRCKGHLKQPRKVEKGRTRWQGWEDAKLGGRARNQCTTGFSTSFFCFCMFVVSTIAKAFQPISSLSLHLENDNFDSNEIFIISKRKTLANRHARGRAVLLAAPHAKVCLAAQVQIF